MEILNSNVGHIKEVASNVFALVQAMQYHELSRVFCLRKSEGAQYTDISIGLAAPSVVAVAGGTAALSRGTNPVLSSNPFPQHR